MAQRELQDRSSSTREKSASLVEFPYAETTYRVFQIIAGEPFTFTTTDALREFLKQADRPSRLLDLASEVIPDIWNDHRDTAGILSALLSTNVNLWQPTDRVLENLTQLCDGAIRGGDWTQVASAEPIAFALGAKGNSDIHRRVLERLIEDHRWREADSARVRKYYGNVGVEIAAIFRHWRDPFRQGLLRANDVSRLIDVLLSANRILAKRPAQRTVLDLLDKHVSVLLDCGEVALAQRVNELVLALRHLGKKEEA